MQANLLRSLIISAALVAFGAATAPTYAADSGTTVTCKDGTSSKGGKGACSHHGGVQKGTSSAAASTAAPSAPAAAAAAAAPAPAPAAKSSSKPAASASSASSSAATAKCKDGTMSHSKHHSGACSHHGGVAEWLDK